MLPAGTIERVDWDDQAVYVDRTKDEIKDSPELGETGWDDPDDRDRLGGYDGDYDGPRVRVASGDGRAVRRPGPAHRPFPVPGPGDGATVVKD